MKLTLGKDKRLKSRKSIDKIFAEGNHFHRFPVRAVYHFEAGNERETKIGVSVPKKKFKRAVDRNLLKRRMREAFRLHQNELNLNGKLNVMFIYSSQEILTYQEIEKAMIALLGCLNSLSGDCTENK